MHRRVIQRNYPLSWNGDKENSTGHLSVPKWSMFPRDKSKHHQAYIECVRMMIWTLEACWIYFSVQKVKVRSHTARNCPEMLTVSQLFLL